MLSCLTKELITILVHLTELITKELHNTMLHRSIPDLIVTKPPLSTVLSKCLRF
jgi:hypothetical protein